MIWIGVDLGGTWVRVVLADERGNFLERATERVDKSSSTAISRQITQIIQFLCDNRGFEVKAIRGVGIASTGPLIQDKGVLIKPTNLPFDYVSLTEPISEELGLPTCLVNDSTGAALGESTFGRAKGLDNFVYVTISTGIGAGAIVNGTLLLGKDGNAHEVGHFVIDCNSRLKCGCGKRGHWEAYCSGRNIPNFVRMRHESMPRKMIEESSLFRKIQKNTRFSTSDLFTAAKQGDKISMKLVNEIGLLNSMGFANVINAYDPSLITVGGTVTLRNRKMILSPIRENIEAYATNRVPEISITSLGYDVCLYGAIAAAHKYLL